MSVAMQLVHDERSHRLNARQIAKLYGLPLATCARAIGFTPENLRSHPDAVKAQGALAELVHAWNILSEIFPGEGAVQKWLYHPNRRLQGQTPMQLLQTRGLPAFTSLNGELDEGLYA